MAEGQGLVELTAEQIKQRGEIEIGAFAQIEAQVDRFYRDQKFGQGRVGIGCCLTKSSAPMRMSLQS